MTRRDVAEEIAGIFEHTGWVWGLALAGIPERVPDANDVAEKIAELLATDAAMVRPATLRLVSDARIVLVFGAQDYEEHVRVLLDVGELPLPRSDA